MHAANIEKSERLKRVLKVLKKYKRPQSTLDIVNKAGVLAVNSVISELRTNGFNITCTRKGKIYYYKLEG